MNGWPLLVGISKNESSHLLSLFLATCQASGCQKRIHVESDRAGRDVLGALGSAGCSEFGIDVAGFEPGGKLGNSLFHFGCKTPCCRLPSGISTQWSGNAPNIGAIAISRERPESSLIVQATPPGFLSLTAAKYASRFWNVVNGSAPSRSSQSGEHGSR
jgi:hypothetical protein